MFHASHPSNIFRTKLNRRKIVAFFAVIAVSTFWIQASSESSAASPFDGNCDLSGDGSAATPYLLGSESDLIDMGECSVSSGVLHFELSNDIFISSQLHNSDNNGYHPDDGDDISLDGQGYGIFGLSLGDGEGNTGIFEETGALTVKDLALHVESISGGSNTGVLAGQASSVDIDNVYVTVDSMLCRSDCGSLVGDVKNGPTTIDNVMVFLKNGSLGFSSGLLIGAANGGVAVNKVSAEGKYVFSSNEGRMGGLIGELDDPSVVSLTDVNVKLLGEGEIGPDTVGGLIAIIDNRSENNVSLTFKGIYAETTQFAEVKTFGGLVGSLKHGVDGFTTTKTMSIDIDDVRLDGRADYRNATGGSGGGLIGLVEADSGSEEALELVADDLLVSIDHQDGAADTALDSMVKTGAANADADYFEVLTFTDTILSDPLNVNAADFEFPNPNFNGSAETIRGVIDTMSSGEARVVADIPFENLVAPTGDATNSAGTLGTDDWEFCEFGGPYPSITPNNCKNTTVALSSNVVSVEVGKASPVITDTAENGFGAATHYLIHPSLPKGMSLHPFTGAISGTPTEVTETTLYEIIKFNGFEDWDDFAGPARATISLTTNLPPTPETPDPEVIRDTVVIEREVPADYTGPLLTDVSAELVNRCQSTEMSMLGQDLEKLKKLYFGRTELSFEINNSRLVFTMPCVDAGEYSLKLESDGGTLEYKKLFNLVDVATGESSVVQDFTADRVVNAGSFKGYVAVYAKGYEGKKLSAKVGNDWVIVDSLGSDFERITDFTGAGYDISVRIFIDGVLTRTVDLRTK